MRRQIVSLALVACLVYVSSGAMCDRPSLLSWSKTAVAALTDAKPILVAFGLPADKLDLAIQYGNKLVAVLENPDAGGGDTRQIAANLINAFEQVVLQTNLIPDGPRKTTLLAFLGLANIALHHIADRVTSTASGRRAAGPAVLKFKVKPVWRCRSAKSGKYQKMEFCRDNPAISVVEKY